MAKPRWSALLVVSSFFNIFVISTLDECTSDCSLEVQVAYNNSDQTSLCASENINCLSDCGSKWNNTDLIDAHCECNTDSLFNQFSYSFAGIPYCCNDFECRDAVNEYYYSARKLDNELGTEYDYDDVAIYLDNECNSIICGGFVSYSYSPTPRPSHAPTSLPTQLPVFDPSTIPSPLPTFVPSFPPSPNPSHVPSSSPTNTPTSQPIIPPTSLPSFTPIPPPSPIPSFSPTLLPSISSVPSSVPTFDPTRMPQQPTALPSIPTPLPLPFPSYFPTASPTILPYPVPSPVPQPRPSPSPTSIPSIQPTHTPTAGNSLLMDVDITLSASISTPTTNHEESLKLLIAAASNLSVAYITQMTISSTAITSARRLSDRQVAGRKLTAYQWVASSVVTIPSTSTTTPSSILFSLNQSSFTSSVINSLSNISSVDTVSVVRRTRTPTRLPIPSPTLLPTSLPTSIQNDSKKSETVLGSIVGASAFIIVIAACIAVCVLFVCGFVVKRRCCSGRAEESISMKHAKSFASAPPPDPNGYDVEMSHVGAKGKGRPIDDFLYEDGNELHEGESFDSSESTGAMVAGERKVVKANKDKNNRSSHHDTRVKYGNKRQVRSSSDTEPSEEEESDEEEEEKIKHMRSGHQPPSQKQDLWWTDRLQTGGSQQDRPIKYNSSREQSDRHGRNRHREQSDKHGSDRHREQADRHGRNRHREQSDRHGSDRHREQSDRHGRNRHREQSDRHGNNRHRDQSDRYGSNRHREQSDRHGSDRHREQSDRHGSRLKAREAKLKATDAREVSKLLTKLEMERLEARMIIDDYENKKGSVSGGEAYLPNSHTHVSSRKYEPKPHRRMDSPGPAKTPYIQTDSSSTSFLGGLW